MEEKKLNLLICTAILAVGLLARLYGINNPLTDSHELRQTQTAIIARNIYHDHMDIFNTRLDFMGYGDKPLLQEFPVMHGITALLYNVFGEHFIVGRIVSLSFSLGALVIFYLLARCFLSVRGALGSLLLFAVSPTNIFFSRAFMPESSMLFFSVCALYCFLRWQRTRKPMMYATSAVCAALACLAKTPAAIILVPIFFAWFWECRWQIFKRVSFWLYYVIAVFPIAAWILFSIHVNSKNPYAEGWGAGLGFVGLSSLWTLPYYVGLVKFVALLLLTPIGAILSLYGVCRVSGSSARYILYSWLASCVVYMIALSHHTSTHAYYSLPFLPLLAITFGFAVQSLGSNMGAMFSAKHRVLLAVMIVVVASGYGYGYYKYFAYMYDCNLRVPYEQEVARILSENTSSDDIVLCNEPGRAYGATLSYLSRRIVWLFSTDGSSEEESVAQLKDYIARGASIYVANKTRYGDGVMDSKSKTVFWTYLVSNFRPIIITDNYCVFRMQDASLSRFR